MLDIKHTHKHQHIISGCSKVRAKGLFPQTSVRPRLDRGLPEVFVLNLQKSRFMGEVCCEGESYKPTHKSNLDIFGGSACVWPGSDFNKPQVRPGSTFSALLTKSWPEFFSRLNVQKHVNHTNLPQSPTELKMAKNLGPTSVWPRSNVRLDFVKRSKRFYFWFDFEGWIWSNLCEVQPGVISRSD